MCFMIMKAELKAAKKFRKSAFVLLGTSQETRYDFAGIVKFRNIIILSTIKDSINKENKLEYSLTPSSISSE